MYEPPVKIRHLLLLLSPPNQMFTPNAPSNQSHVGPLAQRCEQIYWKCVQYSAIKLVALVTYNIIGGLRKGYKIALDEKKVKIIFFYIIVTLHSISS